MVATQTFFIFTLKIWGNDPIDEHIFRMGWFNHQPENFPRCFFFGRVVCEVHVHVPLLESFKHQGWMTCGFPRFSGVFGGCRLRAYPFILPAMASRGQLTSQNDSSSRHHVCQGLLQLLILGMVIQPPIGNP